MISSGSLPSILPQMLSGKQGLKLSHASKSHLLRSDKTLRSRGRQAAYVVWGNIQGTLWCFPLQPQGKEYLFWGTVKHWDMFPCLLALDAEAPHAAALWHMGERSAQLPALLSAASEAWRRIYRSLFSPSRKPDLLCGLGRPDWEIQEEQKTLGHWKTMESILTYLEAPTWSLFLVLAVKKLAYVHSQSLCCSYHLSHGAQSSPQEWDRSCKAQIFFL